MKKSKICPQKCQGKRHVGLSNLFIRETEVTQLRGQLEGGELSILQKQRSQLSALVFTKIERKADQAHPVCIKFVENVPGENQERLRWSRHFSGVSWVQFNVFLSFLAAALSFF